MPQKWAIELSVEGDLKFLSHHDMMRAMERLVRRASLPVRYSQGFNPRPSLSLILPRPVGVASRAEMLMLALEEDVDEQSLLQRFNQAAPAGLKAHAAHRLTGRTPQARRARYELPLRDDQLEPVRLRLERLAQADAWPFQRRTAGKGSARSSEIQTQDMDLRPLVQKLELIGSTLHVTLAPAKDAWARPAEVLALLGLDERADLAEMVRADVDYAYDVADNQVKTDG